MNVDPRRAAAVHLAVCIVTAALAVLTVAYPAWIESALGVDPDSGSGAFEWLVVVAAAAVSIVTGLRARHTVRQLRAHRQGA